MSNTKMTATMKRVETLEIAITINNKVLQLGSFQIEEKWNGFSKLKSVASDQAIYAVQLSSDNIFSHIFNLDIEKEEMLKVVAMTDGLVRRVEEFRQSVSPTK